MITNKEIQIINQNDVLLRYITDLLHSIEYEHIKEICLENYKIAINQIAPGNSIDKKILQNIITSNCNSSSLAKKNNTSYLYSLISKEDDKYLKTLHKSIYYYYKSYYKMEYDTFAKALFFHSSSFFYQKETEDENYDDKERKIRSALIRTFDRLYEKSNKEPENSYRIFLLQVPIFKAVRKYKKCLSGNRGKMLCESRCKSVHVYHVGKEITKYFEMTDKLDVNERRIYFDKLNECIISQLCTFYEGYRILTNEFRLYEENAISKNDLLRCFIRCTKNTKNRSKIEKRLSKIERRLIDQAKEKNITNDIARSLFDLADDNEKEAEKLLQIEKERIARAKQKASSLPL